MNFIKFEENNDHEGETWFFWLQIDGNHEEFRKLAGLLDKAETEWYTLHWSEVPEDHVDALVEHGGWGYMNYHSKIRGKFVCPKVLVEDGYTLAQMCDDEFYKGRIENHFKKE